MRNLKRALSLALATVMTLGLMVVGTGAVGYDDVADTDNVEAIEVLQAVGIMTGDENGNFNPDNTVTRNEMAVIMSQLLNLDYNYYRGTNPFTDVPAWAAPYVAACAAEGVTSGVGGGLYNGEGNVTAAQAALMIMKALGYFQYQNDFGDDWKVATVRQARLAERPGVESITFRNLIHTDEACVEWHMDCRDTEGDVWQIDMIHLVRGSRYDGYFERMAERIRAVLTLETRATILYLKNATPDDMKVMGVEYYQAVLRDGVRTWDDFLAWRRDHPQRGGAPNAYKSPCRGAASAHQGPRFFSFAKRVYAQPDGVARGQHPVERRQRHGQVGCAGKRNGVAALVVIKLHAGRSAPVGPADEATVDETEVLRTLKTRFDNKAQVEKSAAQPHAADVQRVRLFFLVGVGHGHHDRFHARYDRRAVLRPVGRHDAVRAVGRQARRTGTDAQRLPAVRQELRGAPFGRGGQQAEVRPHRRPRLGVVRARRQQRDKQEEAYPCYESHWAAYQLRAGLAYMVSRRSRRKSSSLPGKSIFASCPSR